MQNQMETKWKIKLQRRLHTSCGADYLEFIVRCAGVGFGGRVLALYWMPWRVDMVEGVRVCLLQTSHCATLACPTLRAIQSYAGCTRLRLMRGCCRRKRVGHAWVAVSSASGATAAREAYSLDQKVAFAYDGFGYHLGGSV